MFAKNIKAVQSYTVIKTKTWCHKSSKKENITFKNKLEYEQIMKMYTDILIVRDNIVR